MLLASRDIIESVDKAWYILAGVSIVLFIGIMGAMVWFVIKYHRSRHPRAADISGNTKLEIAWTIMPTILSVWLFFVGYEGFAKMRNVPEDHMVVEVEARQWAFTFKYPEADDVTSSEMYVPLDTNIKCELSSPVDDVLHSFYLPYFRTKEDCVPGVPTYMWFNADKIGTYNIFCAEFCGKDHARMITKLHVLSQEDFELWLDKKLEHRYRAIDDIAAVMEPDSDALKAVDAPTLYKTYCASCHGPNGEGGLVEGARSFIEDAPDKWKKGVKVTDMFRTLTLGLDGTRMKAFDNLSAWDRFALSHHVASFYKDGPARSAASEAEYQALIKEYKLDEQKAVTRVGEKQLEDAIEEIVTKNGSDNK